MSSNEIPTLSQIISDAIESRVSGVHVCLPAKIKSYDYQKQKAQVVPLLKQKFSDGTITEMPVIVNVPVVFPSSNSNRSFISLPIKKDDTGFLIFCERSLDNWLIGGGVVDPKDSRKHDISDAIFMPGLHDFKNVISSINDSDIIINNDGAKVVLKGDGSIDVDNGSAKVSLSSSGQVNINNGGLTVD